MSEIVDQPPPKRNGRTQITDLVIADLDERRRIGIERYGTPLQGFNGREALVDLYQELQDAILYIRQLIDEDARPADVQATIDELARGAFHNYWRMKQSGWVMNEMPNAAAVMEALGMTDESLARAGLIESVTVQGTGSTQ